jgi:hypothetical protein
VYLMPSTGRHSTFLVRVCAGTLAGFAVLVPAPAAAQHEGAQRVLSEHIEEGFRARVRGDTAWRVGQLAWMTDCGFTLVGRERRFDLRYADLDSLELSRDRSLLPIRIGAIVVSEVAGIWFALRRGHKAADNMGLAAFAGYGLEVVGGLAAGGAVGVVGTSVWSSKVSHWTPVPLDESRPR